MPAVPKPSRNKQQSTEERITPLDLLRKHPVVRIQVEGIFYEIDLSVSLDLTEADVSDTMASHAAEAGFWFLQLSKVKALLRRKQESLRRSRDGLIYAMYTIMRKDNPYVPFDVIRSRVERDEDVNRIRKEVHELEEQRDLLDAIVSMYEHRKFMLTSIGARERDRREIRINR